MPVAELSVVDEVRRRILSAIAACGYHAHLFTADLSDDDRVRNQLLLTVGVSIWSGAEAATRDMFHWISAMIAAPTLIYAGRFFSAWTLPSGSPVRS
ncbi:hypothetical protein [Rhizobium tibeticum]|uniref:hypothetical protein n=1 Tax=Rhizobium tibeticum TaxID=501024 RepID=UPI003B967D90